MLLSLLVSKKVLIPQHDNQDFLFRELLESVDQNVRILLAKYNEKIRQLKDNPEGLALRQSTSIVENICSVLQSRHARQQ